MTLCLKIILDGYGSNYYLRISGQFFVLSALACLKLHTKVICGGTGSTWGQSFYMGTQNEI